MLGAYNWPGKKLDKTKKIDEFDDIEEWGQLDIDGRNDDNYKDQMD